MSFHLSDYTFATRPNPTKTRDAAHLCKGCWVAISVDGAIEHTKHTRTTKLGVGAAIGAVTVPLIIGGGIGVVAAGEAFGIGALEQAVFGGIGFGVGASAIKRNLNNDGMSQTVDQVRVLNQVGVVQQVRKRWFDQPGYDVQVTWHVYNERGERTKSTEWHNPEELFGLNLKK